MPRQHHPQDIGGRRGVYACGQGVLAGSTDGTGTSARFTVPYGIAVDTAAPFVVDHGNHTIRRVTAEGVVSIVGRNGGQRRIHGRKRAASRLDIRPEADRDGNVCRRHRQPRFGGSTHG
jgi:hypothetical protein